MTDVSLEEFAERLTRVIPVLVRSMLRYEQSAMTDGTLTPPQYWALNRVSDRGAVTMNELAASINMRPSTATMLVDRLVAMKLVRRERSREDRRRVLVQVTPAGRRLLQDINMQKKKGLRETFRPLTAGERGQYLTLIETLADRLENQQSGSDT